MRKNWGGHGERKNLVLRRKALGALSSHNIFTHFAINLYPVYVPKRIGCGQPDALYAEQFGTPSTQGRDPAGPAQSLRE